jgi:hypothetical protein
VVYNFFKGKHTILSKASPPLKNSQSPSMPWKEKTVSENLPSNSTENGYKIQSCATEAEAQIGVAPHKIPTSLDLPN